MLTIREIFTSSAEATNHFAYNACYPCLTEAFEITRRNQNCVSVSKAIGVRLVTFNWTIFAERM